MLTHTMGEENKLSQSVRGGGRDNSTGLVESVCAGVHTQTCGGQWTSSGVVHWLFGFGFDTRSFLGLESA